MALAGLVITYNSQKRIKTLLRSMRLVVDELVVVVDKRSRDGTSRICREYADKVVRWAIPDGMPQAVLEEAFALPKSDWILSLNDDELISERILEYKEQILGSPDNVAAYYLPTYWLVSDERHYIASPPVFPQYDARIVRKGMGMQRSKLLHVPLEVKEGQAVFMFGLRVFHYYHLLRSREEREKRWEVMKTKPCYTDIDFFRHFYLWEDFDPNIGIVPDRPLLAENDGGYLK